jgi:hypothetical protein
MADSASPATILDVAKLAKVPPSTVSHALSGRRPVGTAARERIFSAIEILGYTSSYSASHLRKGNSGIIGCYTVDITEPASWAGMGVMISKIWDAVSDPLMGVISDNTRNSLGRPKPYILAAGIMLIPAMAILWFPVSFSSMAARVVLQRPDDLCV